MGIYMIRTLFLVLSALAGFAISIHVPTGKENAYFGVILGLVVGGSALLLEIVGMKKAVRRVFWGICGFLIGTVSAGMISLVVGTIFVDYAPLVFGLGLSSLVILSYLGLVLGIKVEGDILGLFINKQPVVSTVSNNKILDTSVIIDGRIADLCETGFLEGIFIAPHFVLQELQHIADSSDTLKRARGRRGLDILHRIQKLTEIDVRIVEEDFPQIKEVDAKIVALAKKMEAKIITNDLNLNKVAELQGVHVLNINELCNALKPVVLPGETMKVFILKEGKELGQGVAYLDDGTMIVVDEARKWIGKNVDVVVTSVLQTTAGRMIFTRMKEDPEREEYHTAKSHY